MSPDAENGARRLLIYTDGAARGNPGPAGAGVHIVDREGSVVAEVAQYLGEATNNVAEYRALVIGLERARELGAVAVEIRSDSELVVRQMTGEYKVRNASLRVLHDQAHRVARDFSSIEFVHVRRDSNKDADRLANRAIDEADSAL